MNAGEAVCLFRQLAEDSALYNHMPQTGCFFRAEQICHRLQKTGAEPIVVRISAGNRMLNTKIACLENEGYSHHEVSWGFHVAAAAKVKNLDGTEQLMVFDPALFDGPVELGVWSRTMSVGEQALGVDSVQEFPYHQGGDHVLKEIEKSVGAKSPEEFFAARCDRFAGKKIVRRPSLWQRNYYRALETNLCRACG